MRGFVFVVHGAPVSQGSQRAFVNPKNGRAIVTDAKKGLKSWRGAVASAAAENRGDRPLLDGPVEIRVHFTFPRPKSHFRTGRNADVLKVDAPHWVTSHQKGDIDKHLRSILDALTGVLFRDDSQVADVRATKVYGSHSAATIRVTPLTCSPTNSPDGG